MNPMQEPYGTTHGVLKPLEEVLSPDLRFKILVIITPESARHFELKDLHARVTEISLNKAAPPDVTVQFETARNIMLYTWFVYEFQTVAELQAYAALELALRTYYQIPRNKPSSLAKLLERALEEKLLEKAKISAYGRRLKYHELRERDALTEQTQFKAPTETTQMDKWFKTLISLLPQLRNHLAHGNTKLHLHGSLEQLEFCADLVNSLFN